MNIPFLTLILALSVSGLVGCDRMVSRSAEEHIELAKDAEAKGQIKAALIEYKSAVQKAPENAQARWLLGQLYLRTNQGAEAEKELQRAVTLGVDKRTVKPQLAQALLAQGEYQRLFKDITLEGNENPKAKASILTSMGSAKIGLGLASEGCAFFQEAKNTDANFAPAYRGLANCAYLNKDENAVGPLLQTALRIDPNDADTWVLQGDFALARQDTEAALRAFSQAIKHAPLEVSAWYKQGEVYLLTDNQKAAQAALDKIISIEPNHYLGHFLKALILFKQNKTEPAIESTLRTLKISPNHAPAYYLLGSLLYNKGSYQQAAKIFSQYLRMMPGEPGVTKMLAAAYIKVGEPEKALEVLRPALTANTGDAQLYSLAATAYSLKNDPDLAISQFQKASELAPQDTSLLTSLAMARLRAGDAERAKAELAEAARRDPKQIKSSVALALNYLREQKPTEAIRALSAAEAQAPGIAALHNLKGVAYASMKDLARARASFEQALKLDRAFMPAVHNLAKLDFDSGQSEMARKRFLAVLQVDKTNLPAMLALAELERGERQTDSSLAWLNKAAQTWPKAIAPRTRLAEHYVQQRQFQKALVYAREAVTAHPDNPQALNLLGATQMAAGERDNALSSYKKLTAITPDSPEGFYRLGLLQQKLDQLDAARQSLRTALLKKKDFLPAQKALAELEIATRHYPAALALAYEIQSKRPLATEGLMLEGRTHLAKKDYSQAATAFKKALDKTSDNTALVAYHQALTLGGNISAADKVATGWIQKKPDDIFVRTYLAQFFLNTNRLTEAIPAHEWLLKKAPRDANLMNNLAWLYAQTGDKRALKMAQAGYKLAPNTTAILDTYGWLLVQNGEISQGLALLTQAAKKSASPAIQYHYAVALAQSGNREAAKIVLTPLVRMEKNFSDQAKARTLLDSL